MKNNFVLLSYDRKMKGVMKTLEVVIAASILLVGLGFIFIPEAKKFPDDLRNHGYDALEQLDNSGKLRTFTKNNDTSSINSALDPLIGYNFNAVLCKYKCDRVGTPEQKDIVVVDYYISGYPGDDDIVIDPQKVRLYIWE